MTTVQAASSATLNVALAARKAVAALQRVAHREVVPRVAAHVAEAIHRENRIEVAVVPAVMRMITTHRAAVVVEAAGDSSLSQNRQNLQNLVC